MKYYTGSGPSAEPLRLSRLTAKEAGLIRSTDLGRLGTLSKDGWPHVVPVGYVYDHGKFYVPSQRRSVKTVNVRRRPVATLVVDDEKTESGVMLKCQAEVLVGRAAEKWKRYMRDVKGWDNDGETLVLSLKPLRKASWFLKM